MMPADSITASDYAVRGWLVVPLHSIRNGKCTCGKTDCSSPGKHPRTPNGLKDASTDHYQITDWWREWPDANVGIVTGKGSGIFVVDVDAKSGGPDSLDQLEAEHGELPPTVTACTGGGGFHLIFQHPGDELRNRANVKPGIDIRGDGGYIVAPPSNHISGDIYRWDEQRGPGEVEISDAPAYLLELIRKPTTTPAKRNGAANSGHSSLLQRAQQYVAKAGAAAEGNRNSAAFNLAGHLGAFESQGDRLTESEICEVLRGWNLRNSPPLEESELRQAAMSALTNGTPRAPKPVENRQGMPDLRPAEYRDVPQPPQREVIFERITSAELASGDYSIEFLIDGTLVAGQPLIIAGPQKSLKTSLIIDGAISLASAGHFLGYLPVNRACRVAVMSGESGLATLQETANRICRAAGKRLEDMSNLIWSPDLPKFGDHAHLRALERFLTNDKIQVLFIDPAYLTMPSADAGNVMAQGELLRGMSDVCNDVGTMLCLAHHTKKHTGRDPHEPLQLQDIAWSGFAEFARQWWLLNRREAYQPGTGEHRLWLSVGGSAGHSALWAVDVNEGTSQSVDGRFWEVAVKSADEARSEMIESSTTYQEQQREEKARIRLDRDKRAIVNAMTTLKRSETAKTIRTRAGVSGERFNLAIAELLSEGAVTEADVMKPNRKTPYQGFTLDYSNDPK